MRRDVAPPRWRSYPRRTSRSMTRPSCSTSARLHQRARRHRSTCMNSLRAVAPNFAGLKVSDTPFARVAPYLLDGLDVLVGAEALIHDSLAAGAVGAVSGLAAALPELTIAAVRSGSREASERARTVRKAIERFPFHAALKHILERRGAGIAASVRAPLRSLTAAERGELDRLIQERPDDFPARLGG